MKPLHLLAATILALGAGTAVATDIKPGYEFKKPAVTPIPGDVSLDTNGKSPTLFGPGPVVIGFEGISQFDGASLGRNFIPSDGIAAAGKTQIMQATNGGLAVFNKADGTRTQLISDTAWWAQWGQPGSNGDQRVMYHAPSERWIMLGFAQNLKDIQIAISNTSDALGGWRATQFEGFSRGFFNPVADYPTIGIDRNAVYIGTNDFGSATPGGGLSFRGTTLNLIPLNDLFGAGAPTAANVKQFFTPFVSGSPANDFTRGFSIQGVSSNENSTTGNILAVSLSDFAINRYDVLNAGTAAATLTASVTIGEGYTFNGAARQPSVAIAANRRIVDALDDRVGAAVYEHNGRIYAVHTVTPVGRNETRVRWYVIDSATNNILDSGEIGAAGYDYYQGSIAVNKWGQVVIGYNRSGLDPATGNISLLAQMFRTNADGTLSGIGDELVLKVGLTDDYHNGSLFGQAAAGRQRWQDYSSVSVDPANERIFWVQGGFPREYNLPQFGHPGGTGGSRWGTWIAAIQLPGQGVIPEPATWALMIAGFGLVGIAARRRSSREALA